MCGRYTIKEVDPVEAMAARIVAKIERYLSHPRFNVYPSQTVPVITGGEEPKMILARWGLVPFWEKEENARGFTLARSEEAFGKPSFRQGIQKHRCLVPADGYYEWHPITEKQKQPYYISRKDAAPFFMAGIYQEATEVREASFAIITRAPNELMAPIHHRMPVMMPEDRIAPWLGAGGITGEEFGQMCAPYSSELLQAWPVSTLVNATSNDSPECIVPVMKATAIPAPAPKKSKQPPQDELSLFGGAL